MKNAAKHWKATTEAARVHLLMWRWMQSHASILIPSTHLAMFMILSFAGS
jgi:hypothetical protein